MRKFRHWRTILLILLVLFLATPFITRARGDGYSQLPLYGDNFQAYSPAMYALGRCYLLSPLAETLVAAYRSLQDSSPGQHFVYLEMGWKGGGRFDPHRTHRTGTSADFLTPMRHKDTGKPENIPVTLQNRWGYDVRLSKAGEFKNLQLDSRALILHLAALERAARNRGWRIKQVILDQPFVRLLMQDSSFSLITGVPFMSGKAWFPHDGHYHVDFAPL